ncbi:MAG: hypothetical protein ED859_02530 [Desulfuromonadales bacterium]|nr:MAG: hypothetical protein ED859_02530 [Desulfuromonadales bacterium]
MIRRLTWGLLLLLCFAVMPGCYYFRLAAAPLQKPRFVTVKPVDEVFGTVRNLLLQDGYIIEQEDPRDRTILTDFRHFSTRAGGVTQPEGGRLYYHKLRVTVEGGDEGAAVVLESVALEIRSSYVYDEGGKVLSFKKRYPYEHYPGMFDLSSVNWELDRMKGYLESSLRGGGRRGQ